MIRVALDRSRCQGHGRCYDAAPGILEPDEEGYAVLTSAEVDEAQRDAVTRAVRGCPERALSLEG